MQGFSPISPQLCFVGLTVNFRQVYTPEAVKTKHYSCCKLSAPTAF